MKATLKNKQLISIIICFGVALYFTVGTINNDIDILSNEIAGNEYVKDNYSGFFVNTNEDDSTFFINKNDLENSDVDSVFAETLSKMTTLQEDNYKARLDNYSSNKTELKSLMAALLTLAIIGLIILKYEPEKVNLPFSSIDIPEKTLYPSVAIGLLFLWIQFGFSLNSAIDSRITLEEHIDNIENLDDHGFRVHDSYSNRHILSDQGVLDAWAAHFYSSFDQDSDDENHSKSAAIGIFVMLALFMSFIHFICLSIISRFDSIIKRTWLNTTLYIITLFIFVGSSSVFFDEFTHAGWLISENWLLAGLMLLVWMGFKKRNSKKAAKQEN